MRASSPPRTRWRALQEDDRLALMSRMLDPHMRFRLEQTGVGEGWRCLEVAAGNGTISQWLADKVGPTGHVVTSDIDTRFIERLAGPNLEVRQIDLTRDPLGGVYDLVCGRAFLHHIPERIEIVARLAAAVRPGGCLLISEPDFHPALASDSPLMCDFWRGFPAWAADQGIDYFVGRRLGGLLRKAGFGDIAVHGETMLFNGGSVAARYWKLTLEELGETIVASRLVARTTLDVTMALLDNADFWTWQNSYVAASGRKPL
jgi:SAM-dependent methyltransferase